MQQFGNGGTFFRLSVRSGRDIGPLSLFPENELLLLPNTVFEVQTALSSREVRKNSARPVTRATGRIEVTPRGHASKFTIDQTLPGRYIFLLLLARAASHPRSSAMALRALVLPLPQYDKSRPFDRCH
jgi:hypothetical protein